MYTGERSQDYRRDSIPMMFVKDSACSQVALGVRGDTGQSKGGTQKSADAVHSTCDGICLGKMMVRPPGIEPGSKAWKAFIITPRQRSLESVFDWSVEGSDHVGLERNLTDGQWKAAVPNQLHNGCISDGSPLHLDLSVLLEW